MNPDLKIDSLEKKLCPENENLFNDGFWTGVDFVVSAVDDLGARKFLDS